MECDREALSFRLPATARSLMVGHATLRRTSAAAAVAVLGTLALLLSASTFAQTNFALNDAYSVAEDTPLVVAAPGVLANDQGAGLTAEQPSDPPNGTVVAFGANGSFTYQPNPNFSGTDSFTYRARAGSFTDPATVTITVTAVNDPPTAVPNTYTVAEDGTLTRNAADGVRANDTDPETQTNSLTIQLVPGGGTTNGTLALNANGSFTYTPNPNFSGTDTFSYHAVDNSTPPAQSAPATVTITVTPVNDPPVATANTYSTNEDAPLTVPAPGVLADDTDPEGNALTAERVTNVASNTGTVTLNPNGSFTYTPAPGFFGTASFTYRAVDNGTPAAQSAPATVTITVASVNDPPTATNDTYTVNEDATLNVSAPGVLGNDSDPDPGNAITAQIVTTTANGTLQLNPNGSFTYSPNTNFSGTDSFTYRATDNGTPPLQSNIATVTITVVAANDAPIAAPDSYSTEEDSPPLIVAAPGVLANDRDEEMSPLTARLLTGPATASGTLTLNPNGSFTFTPRANFSGTATFTYAAVDNGTPPAQSTAATVTITVAAVNDLPVAVPDTYNATEDTTLSVPATTGVLANDTDIDSPKSGWTASLVSNVTKGTLALSANGSFNYTPGPEYSGPDSFTYRVSDGASPPGQSQPATVTITVAAVNDPPKPVNPGPGPAIPDQTAAEALPFTLNLAPFFMDPEQDPISFPTVANLPSGLTATAAGLISGTPTLADERPGVRQGHRRRDRQRRQGPTAHEILLTSPQGGPHRPRAQRLRRPHSGRDQSARRLDVPDREQVFAAGGQRLVERRVLGRNSVHAACVAGPRLHGDAPRKPDRVGLHGRPRAGQWQHRDRGDGQQCVAGRHPGHGEHRNHGSDADRRIAGERFSERRAEHRGTRSRGLRAKARCTR